MRKENVLWFDVSVRNVEIMQIPNRRHCIFDD